MIYLYTRYRFGCVSTVKAEQWLKKHNIKYHVLSPRNIKENHIKQILYLSNSIDDVLVSRNVGGNTWEKLELTEQKIEEMSFTAFIKLLKKYPLLLKTLILFDDKRIVTGYHEEKIRSFLSSEYRRAVRQKLIL
ncbi:ArsC/Spx/MgsR family protein [Lactococcus petauri]|uniref:ArsC/Spx/MgsR family protein n=1 Tax=Lactococcus petauri TaxID=1940789 RepID=UPI001F59C3CD|nr:ArsC/Spx/MgsR family protein [Lactococcus petauri]